MQARKRRPKSTVVSRVFRDHAVRADEPRKTTLGEIEQRLLGDFHPEEEGTWFDGVTEYSWTRTRDGIYRHQRGPEGSDWGNYRI